MSRWLFRALTATLVVAACLIWRQILIAKEAPEAIGPYGPPIDGAYTFASNYIVCFDGYVATVVSVRGGNRITCAPAKVQYQQ